MAEGIVETLKSSLLQKADYLIGVQDQVRLIEDELETILSIFARIQAMPEIPEHVRKLMEQIKDVIRRAEDLIDTYGKRVSERPKNPIYKTLINLLELWSLGKQLNQTRDTIQTLSHELSKPGVLRILPEEGFICSKKHRNLSNEQIIELHLNELIDLGVVLVDKKKLNGKVKACHLKNNIREKWLMEAQHDGFLHDRTMNTRRLVDHNGTPNYASFIQIRGNPSIYHSVPDYEDILSLSFDTQGGKLGENIGVFSAKMLEKHGRLTMENMLEKIYKTAKMQ